MSYDIDLLAVTSNKDTYNRFKEHVKKHNVSPITLEIFNVLGEYWDNYPTRTEINYPEFRTFFSIVKGRKVKDPSAYEVAFDNLKDALDKPSPIVKDLLGKLIETDYATQIYDVCLKIGTGMGGDLESIEPLLNAYKKEVGASVEKDDVFVKPSLDYLSGVVASGGLNWRLKELNVALGPIRKGDFIIIAARPETGKTTFTASEASYMMTQLQPDEHVIWINNEEASNKVMMRVIQAFHQVTSSDLLANPKVLEAAFIAGGGERFLILDDDSGIKSVHKIATLFKEYKPGLIIFDQLDKVHGFKQDREDLRIGQLYEWARDVAKEYCPVIAISQVDGTGEGEKWIQMNQLRGSKTDKIGEADAIVTIGKSNEPGMDLQRFIHVPKNKLFGGPDTLEAHRHGCFEVNIEPARARYVSKWKTK
ncbi:DNA helicase, DnaB-like, C-terminal [uncultured Caudovirales phage]|uniref:DNA helicase, DnaB-like, C-terminal n=1 Tax=uncultured Caudovirales phage TaxID=2100421 RepID=A0A6J5M6B1_9CAUD|nr:DNA helicase, DnaB-like, C-terminal [uncultured Caudovirales phage]